jgi:hypothetical protein
VSDDGQLPPEKLIGTPCEPENTVTAGELQRLKAAQLVVHENFLELEDIFEQGLKQGIVLSDDSTDLPVTAKEYEQARVYRYLHNYLAAVYSYNEQVQRLINTHRGNPDETDKPLQSNRFISEDATLYTRELAFVRGLRIDFQHGDFSSVELEPVNDPVPELLPDGGTAYRVVFNQRAFREGATNSPDKYLQNVGIDGMRYVTGYLDSFHREQFSDFAGRTQRWFKLAHQRQ